MQCQSCDLATKGLIAGHLPLCYLVEGYGRESSFSSRQWIWLVQLSQARIWHIASAYTLVIEIAKR